MASINAQSDARTSPTEKLIAAIICLYISTNSNFIINFLIFMRGQIKHSHYYNFGNLVSKRKVDKLSRNWKQYKQSRLERELDKWKEESEENNNKEKG
jgi:hypothetical protein